MAVTSPRYEFNSVFIQFFVDSSDFYFGHHHLRLLNMFASFFCLKAYFVLISHLLPMFGLGTNIAYYSYHKLKRC
jgi:hypothetical protein